MGKSTLNGNFQELLWVHQQFLWPFSSSQTVSLPQDTTKGRPACPAMPRGVTPHGSVEVLQLQVRLDLARSATFFFIRGNALVPDIHAASKVLMCLCIIYIMCMCIYLYIYIICVCVCVHVCVCACCIVWVVLYGCVFKKIWTTPKCW